MSSIVCSAKGLNNNKYWHHLNSAKMLFNIMGNEEGEPYFS